MKHRKNRALKNYRRQLAVQIERKRLDKARKEQEQLEKDPGALKITNVHTGEITFVKPIKPWTPEESEKKEEEENEL